MQIPDKDGKPPPKPKKWNAFSTNDSRTIEAAFAKLSDEEDRAEQSGNPESLGAAGDTVLLKSNESSNGNRSLEQGHRQDEQSVKVPVNEDYLFDVDIKHRELGPAYWLGPIYEVRRGTWFDGSTLMPVEENLAVQLEEGYLKTRPWRFVPPDQSLTSGASKDESTSGDVQDLTKALKSENLKVKESSSAMSQAMKSRSSSISSTKGDTTPPAAPAAQQPVLTHRLFGAYMNQVATYQGVSAAWVLSDDFLSKFSSAMFQRFVGGAGTKYIRGYSEVAKRKAPKDSKRPTTPTLEDSNTAGKTGRSKSQPAPLQDDNGDAPDQPVIERPSLDPESRVATLERKMSNLVSSGTTNDPERQDEEERQREEKEIQDDYRDTSGESQDRDIDHLILITHGIGQRLGARFESFNFIHDVNELRKTMKLVYNGSPDLQALNEEVQKQQKNCRVQVLPICWRHMLDFPQQGIKYTKQEHDIADVGAGDEDEYPSLDSITIEGVPALRNIISDLALDVLLYQTPAYRDHISTIVTQECNRILKLFKRRNPRFNGKVSLIGHSLGSAIMFDILSNQANERSTLERTHRERRKVNAEWNFKFDVDSFFCFGSPIGLFQMLKGQTIAGRSNPNQVTLDGFPDSLDDPFSESPYSRLPAHTISAAQQDALVSSPKCRQLYNIFHPTDPIAYRLEPLVTPAMSSLKPQALPYTKKNFFGAPMGQGFTGIPAKVGQSFTGFWSNFSSGLANSFINRSLGLSAEDAAKLNAPPSTAPSAHAQTQAQSQTQTQVQRERSKTQSLGAGTNIVGGGVIPHSAVQMEKTASEPGGHSREASQQQPIQLPTLIDQEMETLYSGFQKNRKGTLESDTQTRDFGESPMWSLAEERGRKLRREEAKVRALNSNGRIDYSIQE